MTKSQIWSLKLWFTTLKELNRCFGCSKTCKCAYWLYFIDSIGLSFQNSWIRRRAMFELCIRKYLFLAIRRSLSETLPGYTFTSSIFASFLEFKAILWVKVTVILNETPIRKHCWKHKKYMQEKLFEVKL